MRFWLLVGLLSVATTLSAQDVSAVRSSDGAVLRALDSLNGHLEDIEIKVGETVAFQRLEITLGDCRYPVDNPVSDAFAYLTIRDIRETDIRFEGWMTAASPALSAMDHPRYDVWVLRCKIPAAETSDGG